MFSLSNNNKYSKQKHSQIKGLVVKYLKSDFRAILGQLRIRLLRIRLLRIHLVVVMDDMLLIIHHMRFSLRSKLYF